MGSRQHLAHHLGGSAGVHQVVDDEDLGSLVEIGDLRRDRLENLEPALGLVIVIGGDADGLDHPDIELTRDDRRRNETAPGDGDDGVERASRGEAPGERPRVAVELVPRNRKRLLAGGGHWRLLGAKDCLPITSERAASEPPPARSTAFAIPQRAAASPDSSATIASTARRAAATASPSLPRTTIWLLKRPSLKDG